MTVHASNEERVSGNQNIQVEGILDWTQSSTVELESIGSESVETNTGGQTKEEGTRCSHLHYTHEQGAPSVVD